MKRRTKEASIASVALLLALVGSAPLAASLKIHPVLAQASPTAPVPPALPSGTPIDIRQRLARSVCRSLLFGGDILEPASHSV